MKFFLWFIASFMLGVCYMDIHRNSIDTDVYYDAQFVFTEMKRDIDVMNIKDANIKVINVKPVKMQEGFRTYRWIYEYTDEKGLVQRREGLSGMRVK